MDVGMAAAPAPLATAVEAYWKVTDGEQGIVITCHGHDKAGTVLHAVQGFEGFVAKREGSFLVIADLRKMTGYESESRVAWQQVFRQHRKRMRALILVGAPSKGIRMGAAVVGAVAGVPVRFVEAWSEVESAAASI
jgi:hypothetical protein